MKAEKDISGLICVSSRDVDYLFKYALISCLEKIDFISEINILTPRKSIVKNKLLEIAPDTKIPINVISDSELLSRKEMELCGWSKQQIIKLRSHKLSDRKDILVVGADTVVLRKLMLCEFYRDNELLVNYRKHDNHDKHYQFELERCKNIFYLLGLNNSMEQKLMRDYIFDIFLLKRAVLKELEKYLFKKFGKNYFFKVFPISVNGYEDMVKTGEWTMYNIFVIKILKLKYRFQDGTKLVHQIHSHKELSGYDYSDKAVHFVRKDFDINLICSNIKNHINI